MATVLVLLFFFSLSTSILPSYGFDPLDPQGNITIRWDLMSSSGTNDLKVTIFNQQLYRHIEPPGWKLKWHWLGKEVIWDMRGAEATEQGNCSEFKTGNLPHSCERAPVIVDLLPGAPYNMQTKNCCKGGVLSSLKQDPSLSVATFQLSVSGGGAADSAGFEMPVNFSLGVPGYSCSNGTEVKATKFPLDGRRWTQALKTWNVTCMYSPSLASPTPKCCVSLSAFYDSNIVPCPKCSCSCQGQPGSKCVKFGETPSLLKQKEDPNEVSKPVVRCTQHMCPIRVHWHVKQNYKQYWRVKMTVTNFNIMKNYSDWNLVVLHPNLKSLTQVFSFNYSPLGQYGYFNDTGMFWGLKFYNQMLVQEGVNGNVQSEILLAKDTGNFTFKQGWAFPRRITFNGDECVMPQPDDYPKLPNDANSARSSHFLTILAFMLVVIML
ncbi:COBRA-like protein 6 [Turnera subulata]|uniref:COBRA-like protein n=1 Tax=Turnera subulata TaxID=218843 RepID=A0A9Q0FM06_9ROSI|nr:COBRA-like protein 6 [Turnera subulata]